MTKTTKKATPRFKYMQEEAKTPPTPIAAPTPAPVEAPASVVVEAHPVALQKPEKAQPVLKTVARGQGRMEQAREQLNVRLPTDLKRRAIAGAALEGLTAGELIERLLLEYLAG
jgi:hypothetical protein